MQTLDPGAPTLSPAVDTATADADAIDAALAASGDGHAFERLYRRHVTRVYNLARRMLGGGDPDEVTQEVFVRTWRKLGTFRGEAAFGTWLHRVAVNVILAHRAARGRERQRDDQGEATLDLLPSRPSGREDSLDFEKAMVRLPDGARQVFVLHDVEGYKHEEIAGMLAISTGTSKSQLHHARMALRRYLEGR